MHEIKCKSVYTKSYELSNQTLSCSHCKVHSLLGLLSFLLNKPWLLELYLFHFSVRALNLKITRGFIGPEQGSRLSFCKPQFSHYHITHFLSSCPLIHRISWSLASADREGKNFPGSQCKNLLFSQKNNKKILFFSQKSLKPNFF